MRFTLTYDSCFDDIVHLCEFAKSKMYLFLKPLFLLVRLDKVLWIKILANPRMFKLMWYSVFHQFRQAKFAYDGLILSSSHFSTTAPAASKYDAHYYSGQNCLKNIHLGLYILKQPVYFETDCIF
jgi:hypothetical protein